MSEQNAQKFIQQTRANPAMIAGFQAHTHTLEDLVLRGVAQGLAFTTDELRIALKRDWAERQLMGHAPDTKPKEV